MGTALGYGAAAVFGMMTLVWVVSVFRKDAGIIDIFWGPGFAAAAWVYFMNTGGWIGRSFLVAVLVTVWGFRLGLHILLRSRGHDEDYRYRAMREKRPDTFWIFSLVGVFWLQAVILLFVSLPLLAAQTGETPERWNWLDGVGIVVFLTGFLFEAVGDYQLVRFKADPANRGKVLNAGLWRYTRHPNYFGDALVWWGLYLIAVAGGGWWTLLSPVLMTFLLMKVSGVALLEQSLAEKKPEYRDYVLRTNAFFPGRPR